MAEKRIKAERWRRNAERLETGDDVIREIIDISEKRQELAALLEEQIRQWAHELYEARGRKTGHEVEDWLQAEAEILTAGRQTPAASSRVIPSPFPAHNRCNLRRRRNAMFARLLVMTVKPEMKPELIRKMRDEVLPIFKKYKGFVDVIPLEVETEPTMFYAISLWHEKSDAEKYEKENFSKVKTIYEPCLTMPIVVKHCQVDETIFKKMAAVAA